MLPASCTTRTREMRNGNANRKTLLQMLPPPSPTPSHKSNASVWRGTGAPQMNNRPLPEPPRSVPPSEGGGSSRSGTPKSVFDTISRPPSVQLEKIKTKANATLDRMAQLQMRYRQQRALHETTGNSSSSALGSEQVSSDSPAIQIPTMSLI